MRPTARHRQRMPRRGFGEEPEIIGVDAETRIQGAKGRAKNPPFCFMPRRVLAAAAATAYLDKAQVSAR